MANAPSRPRPINGAGAPWCPHPKTDGQGTANAGIAMKQSHVANVNIFICTTLEARFAVSEARLYEFRMPSSGPYGLTLTAYRSPLARLRARRRLAGRYGRHGAGSDRSRPDGSDRFWGLLRSDRIERAFALFVGATRHSAVSPRPPRSRSRRRRRRRVEPIALGGGADHRVFNPAVRLRGRERTTEIGSAGRPAKSRWCKSITMKEQRSTSAPSHARAVVRPYVKR
jgi:hypothetical protein